MRKLALVSIPVLLMISSYAQNASLSQKNYLTAKEAAEITDTDNAKIINITETSQLPDGAMMSEGKMIWIRKGEEIEMKEFLIMRNGSRVMCNGVIFTKKGKMVTLKEGWHIDMNGVIKQIKKQHIEN